MGRQVAASKIELAACVYRSGRCLCNCEELVAPETLDPEWKLGRHRIQLRLAYGAIAERHLRSGSDSNTKSEFETLWQSAAGLSQDVPNHELMLARLATKWQLADHAQELWIRVEENPTMRREALDNLRQLYRAKDETTKLYTVLQRLHESSPNEAPITADLARLGLNLGENTEISHQLAKRLMTARRMTSTAR